MNDKQKTRQQILEAAMNRIVHYGYGKTTMSEIARDCDMSAGNIYRFFASKIDIAEAMARKFNAEIYQVYAEIARASGTAEDRLRKLFMYGMERTHTAMEGGAKILEVVAVLDNERPLFFKEQMVQERIHLCHILEDGAASGEFAPIGDSNTLAEMIQAATVKFRFPQLFSRLTLPKLKRELSGVMNIVIAALSAGVDLTPAINDE